MHLVHKIPVGSSDPKNGGAARPGKGALQTSRQCPRAVAAPLLILSVGDWVDSSRKIQSQALPTFLLEVHSVLN